MKLCRLIDKFTKQRELEEAKKEIENLKKELSQTCGCKLDPDYGIGQLKWCRKHAKTDIERDILHDEISILRGEWLEEGDFLVANMKGSESKVGHTYVNCAKRLEEILSRLNMTCPTKYKKGMIL